jgi:hypothetical protein
MRNSSLCHFALVVLIFAATQTNAQTVYKTVNQSGVVSFSDTAPTNDADVETLEISTPAPGNVDEYNKHLQDMRETTDRLVEDRQAREKHRAEMLELQASRQAAQAPVQPAYNYPLYSSSYSRRYQNTRPPYYPGHRPKPGHPIAYPPLRPSIQPRTGSNAQLMRPLVSGPR